MKRIFGTLVLAAGMLLSAHASAACCKVTIADMNWNSASVLAHIDGFILRHGYGCEVEFVPGDTVPTSTSMTEKGEPDIASELWTNSIKAALKRGVAEKRLRIAGKSLSDGGEEGFWVPKYMVDKDPALATIGGIRAKAKLFRHPERSDRSAFYGCPAGWACQITSGHLFKALKLAKSGFEIVDPGSGAGLAGAIAKAYERRQPWFGYYWAPTAVLGKYPMVKVDFGSGVDAAHFVACITKPDCTNPKATMFPPAPVRTVTTEGFAARAPEAYRYLEKRAFTNARMNELLAWMKDNQADGDVAMEHFLKKYELVWSAWVPAAAAAKVKKALAKM